MPRVALTTLGCKVNQFETEAMEGLFRQQGYDIVPFDQEADIYVINTCSVTHLGEKKSRQLIRRALRQNNEAVIAVTGCYSQIAADEVARIEGVKVVLGTKQRHQIVELVERAAREGRTISALTDIMQAKEFEDIPLFHTHSRTRAFLKIQEGCTNFCTYCIIPFTRGPLRSRKLMSIRQETQKLVEDGFKEIVLTGIHLGAYGKDLPEETGLFDAVREMLAFAELKRLRLGSLESIEVSPALIKLMQENDRLCPHLHLPLQSGDDVVLRAMHRHYTAQEYELLVADLMGKIPDLAVSTDVIVGFPGETEECFKRSMALIERIPFARLHVFPYSRRAGTPAATYENQVDEQVKKERAHAMQQLADQKAEAYRKKYIGKTLAVLLESEADGIIDGLTGNYLRVYTAANANTAAGMMVFVRLEKTYKDGLWGTVGV